MRKAILPVLGIVAAATVLAACSSSSKSGGTTNPPPASDGTTQQAAATDSGAPSDSTSACKPDVVVQFCETIDITGAVTVSGTAAAIPELEQGSVDSTCASWVDHQPENTDYPQFATPNDAVDGHKILAHWKLPYKVGTYEFAATTPAGDPNFPVFPNPLPAFDWLSKTADDDPKRRGGDGDIDRPTASPSHP